VLLRTCGEHLRDEPVTAGAIISALRAGLEALTKTGKTQLGDKTLVDVLEPFLRHLEASFEKDACLRHAWAVSIPTAHEAANETAQMTAKKGRAAALGERSLGTVDPGARSMELILEAISASLSDTT
jgi:dihydroxyacetone kinase